MPEVESRGNAAKMPQFSVLKFNEYKGMAIAWEVMPSFPPFAKLTAINCGKSGSKLRDLNTRTNNALPLYAPLSNPYMFAQELRERML